MEYRLGRVYEDKQIAVKNYREKGSKNKNNNKSNKDKTTNSNIGNKDTSNVKTMVIDL